MRKKLTIGILAHVDAGKTTLSEALLFTSGKIRKQGRVDHKDTFLDTNAVERERGITIFSKQARFSSGDCDFILLDTPGHVDFSAETERTLALLDYAILVISAPDGVQNHTKTLWQLLELYDVPTFIFVNKTDVCTKLLEEVEAEISARLSSSCVGFFEQASKHELDERLALTSEDFLESFLAGEGIDDGDISYLISCRKLFCNSLLLLKIKAFVACKRYGDLVRIIAEALFGSNGNVSAGCIFNKLVDLIGVDLAVNGVLDHSTA